MWETLREGIRGDKREQPQMRLMGSRPAWAEVIRVVEELRGEKWESFRDRHGDWGRELGLYLGRKVGGIKLAELGVAAGDVDYAAVSVAVKRFERRMSKERSLARLAREAAGQLLKVET